MLEAGLKLLASIAAIVAIVVGDKTLAKWVAFVKLWYRQWTEKGIKDEAERLYSELEREWNEVMAKKERQGGTED